MNLGSKLSIISISLLTVVACQKSYSDQKDIGTDLHASGTMYFSGENSFIVRGTCEDAKPALPAFCKKDIVKIAERDLKDSFVLELQRQAKSVSDEVAPLEDQYSVFDSKYTDLETMLSESETKLKDLQAKGLVATNDLDAFNKDNAAVIAAYETEGSRIASALRSKPNDADLLQEKAQVEKELADLVAQRTELTSKKDEYFNTSTGLIPETSKGMANIRSQLDQVRGQMSLVEKKLSLSRKNQIAILQKIDGIDVAIAKIKEGVRYTALKSNNHLFELRPILEMFNVKFDQELAKITAPVVGNPTGADPKVSLQAELLMVLHNGKWLGVCDDNFEEVDAKVACRSLGKNFVSFQLGQRSASSSFAIDNIACTGNESSILSCPHAGLGVENCSETEHVKLVCN